MWWLRQQQPVESKVVIRFLLVLVLVLSMFCGYFFTKYKELQSEYERLEYTKLELIELDTTPVE